MAVITMSTGHRLSDVRRELARIPQVTAVEAARMVATINRAVAKCSPVPAGQSRGVTLPPSATVTAALTGTR